MGSVKDLDISSPAFENQLGVGEFTFSDRYSVFDWGEMPDHLPNKGRALAIMGAFNFEELEKRGVRTHYRGLIAPDGSLIRTSDLDPLDPTRNSVGIMQVRMAVRYDPVARQFMGEGGTPEVVYDYSFFSANRGKIGNFLVPLEIIFRNGLPLGSSVFKKIESAKEIEDPEEREATLQEIYQSLGLISEPQPGDMLPKPVMNYTTKLEPGDRSLTEDEAYYISGLTQEQFSEVEALALRVNKFVSEQARRVGLVHYDGKVEMIFSNGLCIADVVGTFDEDRFGLRGEQVSKEFLRQWYKQHQPEFPVACDEWKETGKGWQERCPVKPIRLPVELSTLVSQMYMAGCDRYVQRPIFSVLDLENVMENLKQYKG